MLSFLVLGKVVALDEKVLLVYASTFPNNALKFHMFSLNTLLSCSMNVIKA